jgi:D-psicose/D-tagatose/L-ribulose 3-epimerase
MVKWGVHSLLWTDQFDHEPERIARKARAFGFDGVEIFVSPAEVESFDRNRVRRALNMEGLECIGCVALDPSTDVSSSDENTRRRGVEHLEKAAELFSELGANLVSGITYGVWGKLTGKSRTEEEWDCSVRSLREACRAARKSGVVIGVEPCNRFQTHFLSTAADAVKLAKEVNEPNIGVHLDTFHMNIEEKNFHDPIVSTGELLCYLHCCENDRGVAGAGNIDWDALFQALGEIRYDKWITLESYTPEIQSLAAGSAVWRQVAPSADAIASEGLKFVKSKQKQYERN